MQPWNGKRSRHCGDRDSVNHSMALMREQSLIERVLQQEDLNFVLTNRIPRRLATRFVGWFSDIRQPLVRDASIGIWKFFAGDPRLHEAKKDQFDSLHDCFIRELKEG